MNYKSTKLQVEFVIDELITVHYYEYKSDFSFEGERHDFWEFLCVDRGEVNVAAGDQEHTLKKGDIIFHKPNEFHNVKANGIIAPNLVVIAFICTSHAMDFFQDKCFQIGETERNLMASILIEAKNSFSSRLDDPYLLSLTRRSDCYFGANQLISMYLSQLLIHLYRRNNPAVQNSVHTSKPPKSTSGRLMFSNSPDSYERVFSYLEDNIGHTLTIDKICRDNLIGRSQLQKIFREKNNCGIIDFFNQMKIKAARQMIRDSHLNFTQISEALGYNSIHYFSRQFKKITGMTPSEYASSIKVLSDPPEK